MKTPLLILLLLLSSIFPQRPVAQDDSRTVITSDNVLQLEELAVLLGPATDMSFSYDGHLLAVSTYSDKVIVWDMHSEPHLMKTLEFSDHVHGLAFSPVSDTLAVGADGRIELWDIRRSRRIAVSESSAYEAALAFSPDGTALVSGKNLAATVRDASTGEVLSVLSHDSVVSAASFSPNGALLATGGWDGVRLWEVEGWHQLYHLTGFEGGVGHDGIAFSPDGTILAVGVVPIAGGGGGGDLKLFDVQTGEELANLGERNYPVASVSFNLDGDIVVGDTKLWDVGTGLLLAELNIPIRYYGFSIVKFSPDGTLLVGCSQGEPDPPIRVWGIP